MTRRTRQNSPFLVADMLNQTSSTRPLIRLLAAQAVRNWQAQAQNSGKIFQSVAPKFLVRRLRRVLRCSCGTLTSHHLEQAVGLRYILLPFLSNVLWKWLIQMNGLADVVGYFFACDLELRNCISKPRSAVVAQSCQSNDFFQRDGQWLHLPEPPCLLTGDIVRTSLNVCELQLGDKYPEVIRNTLYARRKPSRNDDSIKILRSLTAPRLRGCKPYRSTERQTSKYRARPGSPVRCRKAAPANAAVSNKSENCKQHKDCVTVIPSVEPFLHAFPHCFAGSLSLSAQIRME